MVSGPEATLVATAKRDWNRPTARDWAEVLERLPLFANVSKRHLRKIAELAHYRVFEPGDIVVQTRDDSDSFYVILGGRATVPGRPHARALSTGDYFGEMALLDGQPRSATVRAVGELQTMRIPRRPFLRLLEQEPTIAIALLTELAARLRRAEESTVA
ncbi:MAG TPA: cyclic nucleotide-binding domain-containing protein [Gaiellaceae bacterium]|jgi:CRP-like cAMP-binding protein|nr:cyclic nucleotide-binding domain-containing protein [Gaiellaceae bacterium]